MGKTMRWLTVFLSSTFTTSCMHRAESLKMLEVRADYAGKDKDEASELKLDNEQFLRDTSNSAPVRTAPKTAQIWIFPHETPDKEYFWGGWISVVVEGDHWDVDRPGSLAPAKPAEQSHAKTPKKPRKEKT